MYMFHKNRTLPPNTLQADGRPEWVFVFGSNLAGRHGAGAALVASQKFQARTGVGYGREGISFAIPTKDTDLDVLPLTGTKCKDIRYFVELFKLYALHRQDAHEKFFVTAIGTELAGYTHAQIAPLFIGSPENCSFPEEWMPFLAPEEFDKLALFNETPNLRYFYHPESESLFTTNGEEPGTDGLVEEISADRYTQIKTEHAKAQA